MLLAIDIGNTNTVLATTTFRAHPDFPWIEGATMQRDHDWHSARHLDDLEKAADIGRRAGERAVAPTPRRRAA